MKKLISSIFLCVSSMITFAQEGNVQYYLPKTQIKFHVLVERTRFIPGEYADYAERYLREKASDTERTTYRIVSVDKSFGAIPDTTKHHELSIDRKHSILNLTYNDGYILAAINGVAKHVAERSSFKPAPQRKALDPKEFLSEEILSAGSNAKTAELIAKDIYDIRESRNSLSRGEADFMPKDGAQLRIMLQNLDRQEAALKLMFCGVTYKDTVEKTITFTPSAEVNNAILFRFSEKLGIVDSDDLAGAPIYVNVEDEHIMPAPSPYFANEKDLKKAQIFVNVPGKIKVTVKGANKTFAAFETFAPQFGNEQALNPELFGKKAITKLILTPLTGAIESIETQPL